MALATIAVIADCGSDNAAALATGKAASTFVGASGYLIYAGDTLYPIASTATEYHVPKICFNGSPGGSFDKARACATPGNHDNGSGVSGGPNVASYLRAWSGTLSKVSNLGTYPATGVPNTDQFIDIAGWRFHFINSGGINQEAATPGWPVPHSSSMPAGNARVTA